MSEEQEKIPSVTKTVLAESIYAAIPSITTKKAAAIVDGIVDGIQAAILKNEEVKISGFGKFSINDKKARKGRNPKTGEVITISSRRVLKFKVSDCLKDEMNKEPFNE